MVSCGKFRNYALLLFLVLFVLVCSHLFSAYSLFESPYSPVSGQEYVVPAGEEDVSVGGSGLEGYWGTGVNEPSKLNVELYQEYEFDVGYDSSMRLEFSACWSGGTDGCGHTDYPEFDIGKPGYAQVQIFNGVSWVDVGAAVNLGDITASSATELRTYSVDIDGFGDVEGPVKVRIKTYGLVFGKKYDVEMFTDSVRLIV